jgi:lysozyme family protein
VSFEKALPVTLAFEGGYVDNPLDRGGPTNFGVTQNTYSRWLKMQGEPDADVRDIPEEAMEAIYRTSYWDAAHCGQLAEPLDLCHFDAAVNHGPERAIKMLQEAAGVTIDGLFGPHTLAAIQADDPIRVADRYLDAREGFYRLIVARDPTQQEFLPGWEKRVGRLRSIVAATPLA